jgi:5'-nucleotidase
VDAAFFQGGVSKDEVLHAFGADIFFDDMDSHLDKAIHKTPSAKVPYRN